MNYDSLLALTGSDPVFSSSLLLAGGVQPNVIRTQLSRWVTSGRILQLRRGLYAIAPPYQKTKPHPFHVANHLQRASYISLQSALSYYGMIPENALITTSVSTSRPGRFVTPLGIYYFHHLKISLLFGYQMIDLGGQSALVATPEKALLDLVYLHPGGDAPEYLNELRLQNLEKLDARTLKDDAKKFGSPKMIRAVEVILRLVSGESVALEDL